MTDITITHGDTASGVRALLAAPAVQDGIRLDWSQTIDGFESQPDLAWDSTDEDIEDFFADELSRPSTRATALRAIGYWQDARDNVRHARELAQEALAVFDRGDYTQACCLVGDAASYERSYGERGAPLYGPVEAAFATNRAVLDDAELAIAKGRARAAAAAAEAEAEAEAEAAEPEPYAHAMIQAAGKEAVADLSGRTGLSFQAVLDSAVCLGVAAMDEMLQTRGCGRLEQQIAARLAEAGERLESK